MFIKVMAGSFLLTLILAAPYLSRRAPELFKSLTRPADLQPTAPATTATNDTPKDAQLEALLATRQASGKQVKPSFDSLPLQFFPNNQAFSLDFHKLPTDYLVPQAPEVTHNAVALIKQFRDADQKAFDEQKRIAAFSLKTASSSRLLPKNLATGDH